MYKTDKDLIQRNYEAAKKTYAAFGVDTDAAIAEFGTIPVSLHCWQADDVRGLETPKEGLDSGGIMATGGYPGRARNGDEMRADLDVVLKLLPGRQRLNLHAFYAETGRQVVDRDALEPAHFARWLDWAAPVVLVGVGVAAAWWAWRRDRVRVAAPATARGFGAASGDGR